MILNCFSLHLWSCIVQILKKLSNNFSLLKRKNNENRFIKFLWFLVADEFLVMRCFPPQKMLFFDLMRRLWLIKEKKAERNKMKKKIEVEIIVLIWSRTTQNCKGFFLPSLEYNKDAIYQ